MHLRQLKLQLHAGQISPIYLIHGGDPWQTSEALGALKELVPSELRSLNLVTLAGKGLRPADLESSLQMVFIGDRRVIVVEEPPFLKSGRGEESEDKGSAKGDDERWQQVMAQASPEMVMVFALAEKADSRRKLFKWLSGVGAVVDCLPLKGGEVIGYVQELLRQHKTLRFEPGIAELLAEAGGSHLGTIHHELEKLLLYTHGQQTINVVEARAVLSRSAEADIFALTDAVSGRNLSDASELLDDILRRGDPHPLQVFAMLLRQVRLLLTAQAHIQNRVPQAQLATQMGVHPFVAKKLYQQAGEFDAMALAGVLQGAAEKDLAMKTGRLNQVLALQLILAEMAQARISPKAQAQRPK